MMNEVLQIVLRYGYVLLFCSVLIEQAGLPIPSAPILLAAGALAAAGRLTFAPIVILAITASLLGDLLWFALGRRRGHNILRFICRISLEPDSCVRSTEDIFVRHGGRALLAAKFVPGLSTAAPPMAGLLGMSLTRFLLLDLVGAGLWAGTFCGVGFLFSTQIEDVALLLARFGSWAVVFAVTALGLYLGWKFVQRRRFIRRLRVARIAPEELAKKLADGEEVVIVDLRHEIEFQRDGVKLPGAIRMTVEEIEQRRAEIPLDKEIVLYCT